MRAEARPLPKAFTRLRDRFPQVAEAHERLGAATSAAGPLDERTRALAKLALAVGARQEGGVHAHARRALEAGCAPDALRHVALLGVTTIGFPTAVAALTWIEETIEEQGTSGGRA